MKPNGMKIRVVGSEENCERILSLLMPEAKIWGARRMWKVRKFKRDPERNKYSSTFGNAEAVYYVTMSIRDRKEEAST